MMMMMMMMMMCLFVVGVNGIFCTVLKSQILMRSIGIELET